MERSWWTVVLLTAACRGAIPVFVCMCVYMYTYSTSAMVIYIEDPYQQIWKAGHVTTNAVHLMLTLASLAASSQPCFLIA